MTSLNQKVAIVTGASRGIGRAVAEKLGSEGAAVVVNYAGNAAKAAEVVAAIEAKGGQALAFQADMSKTSEIASLFDATERHFGKLDIVISAAAVSIFKPHIELTEVDFEKIMSLNLHGVFHVLQQAARRVVDGGRIVQFSSGATRMPFAGAGLYSASKAAGEQLALALAKELGSRQITVNLISPGVTRTDGLIMPEQAIEYLVHQTPLGRLGLPDDIADVVTFLCSDAARWVNGQNIQVNGGIL